VSLQTFCYVVTSYLRVCECWSTIVTCQWLSPNVTRYESWYKSMSGFVI